MAITQELTLKLLGQSTQANNSKVQVVWQSTQTEMTEAIRKTGYYYVSFNEGPEYKYTVSCSLTPDSTVTVLDTIIHVPHEYDGTGSVRVMTKMDTGEGIVKTQRNFHLDRIHRETAIDGIYCSTNYFNGKISYTFTPTSSELYNLCEIYAASQLIRSIRTGKCSPASQKGTLVFTEDELKRIYALLPETDQGNLRLSISTFSDGYKTLVGPPQNEQVTLYIPDDDSTKPTAKITLSPYDDSESAILKKLYIKGRNKVSAVFSDFEGKYGASLKSYEIRVGGNAYGDPYISDYLSTDGKVTVTGVVEDSRGFKREYTQDVDVLSYAAPKIIPAPEEVEILCDRCNEDGTFVSNGTYLKVKAKRAFSTLAYNGSQYNFCEIRYRHKEEDDAEFSDWATLLDKTAATDTVVSAPLANVVPSAASAYVVQVGVIDDIGESSFMQFKIASDFVSIDLPEHLKGRRMGLMGYAKESNEPGIDVGVPIYGGSVDSLKTGTKLFASAETPISLNNFKTPGCYYSPSKDVSQHITDSPYKDGGFGLKVREIDSESNIQQILFYGRTRWERSCISDEWSQWACPIMVDASNTTDFVVDYGEDSHWIYRKWDSGFAECYGTFKQKVNCTNAWGSLYYGSCEIVDYPLEFVGMPVCNVSVEQTTYDYKSVWLASLAPATATNPCRPIVVSVDSQQANIFLHYHAIGRWK